MTTTYTAQSTTQSTTQRLILITGVSSGFGRALAQAALAAGHRVVGTVRNDAARRDFEQLGAGATARILDVTDFAAIGPVVAGIEADIGPIDVLVNNAGYGHEGILEESPLDEMRRQFDVNVFGAVALMKAVLPSMRMRRRGRILNITSMGGHITMPGIAYYCGSKFALEGISAALDQEVRPLGIAVTAVAPGSFRTDWAGRSMRRSPRAIADYDALFEPVRQARIEKSGKQLGDPAKAAQAMLKLIEADDPPAHLLLGSDALRLVRGRLAAFSTQLEKWEALTLSTDG
ncbi:short-subunit dehydrogenase [Pseudoduganella flava]|uniref:SDR family NAD(P)-dependent oxidoreductase n=1 Tax=Pseudoduganella flava TaxID=871742 RepID=A0A562Q1Y9_9BURK|nr:oxidoreductase [Pseudoduganella flava]QGZ38137.1 SDR family NAD(P)-dependent oxidoreductase [Pseudoduganella flava]TWI50346.1 short-subunit dehydrogenase [Pseudoduganella flava]